jgi:PEP-CTERM motif
MHYISTNTVKIRILLFFVFLLGTAAVAQADPLTFSNVRVLQNNGNTSVNLFSNSGIMLDSAQLTFAIDIVGTLPVGGTDTLSVTYQDSLGAFINQQFAIPVLGVVHPPTTVLVTINVPIFSFVAIPATLTVDLLNSNPDFVLPTTQTAVNSYTYSFNVVQPIPEPATLALFAGGASTLFFKYRKNRKNKKSCAD